MLAPNLLDKRLPYPYPKQHNVANRYNCHPDEYVNMKQIIQDYEISLHHLAR